MAIIAKPDDLGSVTSLWREPQAYAHFLGLELSLAYKGRLLVVMPNGFGFNWTGHSVCGRLPHPRTGWAEPWAVTAWRPLRSRRSPRSPRPMAFICAHCRGHAYSRPAARVPVRRQATGTVRSAPASTRILAFVVLALLVVAIVAIRFLYARKRPALNAVIARVVNIPRAHRRGSLVVGLFAVIDRRGRALRTVATANSRHRLWLWPSTQCWIRGPRSVGPRRTSI